MFDTVSTGLTSADGSISAKFSSRADKVFKPSSLRLPEFSAETYTYL